MKYRLSTYGALYVLHPRALLVVDSYGMAWSPGPNTELPTTARHAALWVLLTADQERAAQTRHIASEGPP